MTQSASQWAAFAREVAAGRRLWTLRDAAGFPAPLARSGERAQPFWSSLPRLLKVQRAAGAYSELEPYEISWEDFRDKWAPGLARDGIRVGVNWSGPKATGYDVRPSEAVDRIAHEVAMLEAERG
jgi:hypothetical protein